MGGWPVTFGGRRFQFNPDRYFEADAPPEKVIASDDDQMRDLIRTLMGDEKGNVKVEPDGDAWQT